MFTSTRTIFISLLFFLVAVVVKTAAGVARRNSGARRNITQLGVECPESEMRGQCLGSTMVGFAAESYSYMHCLELCRTNVKCAWFTHFADTYQCIQFAENCNTIKVCDNCLPAEVGFATSCDMKGFCSGKFIAANHKRTLKGCQKLCQEEKECEYFSYKSDTKDCILTKDCPYLDQGANFIANKKHCKILPGKLLVTGLTVDYSMPNNVDVVDIRAQGLNCSHIVDYPRNLPVAGAFIDDVIMICGGQGENDKQTNKCFSYVFKYDVWKETHSMTTARWVPAAVQISDTQWWITGGRDDHDALNSSEIFTAGKGFSKYVDLPEAMSQHNLVKVNDTHIILLNGRTWMFDLNTELWTSLPDQPVEMVAPAAGLVTHPDGATEIVVSTGKFTQVLSLDTMVWRQVGNYSAPLFLFEYLRYAISLPYGNTFLVVSGSIIGHSPKKSVFSYRFEDDTWVEKISFLNVKTAVAFLLPESLVECS